MKDMLEEAYAANYAKLTAMAERNYSTDLLNAERRTLHDSVRPGPAKPLPIDNTATRCVRAEFLRWLLNDSQATPLIYKDGLQVVGATVDGEVDLDASRVPCFLVFRNCVFTGNVHFVWADTRSIEIQDCVSLGNISFENCNIQGDLDLNGLQSTGSITMYGARVAGDLSLKKLQMSGKGKELSINHAEVKGTAYFEGLSCAGPVWMLNTKTGSDLIASGAIFGSTLTMTGASNGGRPRHVRCPFVRP